MSKKDGKQVRLKWSVPRDMRAIYANNIIVNHQDGVFQIYLFDAVPPPLLDEASLDSLTEVEAMAVARIVVSPQSMPGFIQALQTNHKRYLDSADDSNDSEGND